MLETIGDHIKRARLDRDLTQRKVAELIGVSRDTVANWESGWVTDPEIRFGPAIISFLGYVPLEALSTLPERVHVYRLICGFSQRKAAREIGVDPTTWMHWELGNVIPRIRRPRLALASHVLPIVDDARYRKP